MPNPGSGHQDGSSSYRSRDDARYNAYKAVNSWSNAMDIDSSSNHDGDISRLAAQLPEEDYDDIVTEPDRMEEVQSSSAPGGSSSRRRHAGRTSSRRNESGSSGGGHSSRSGRSSGSGRSIGAGRSSDVVRSSGAGRSGGVGRSSHEGGPSGGRGFSGSSRAGASRETRASTQFIWRCNMCPRSYGSRLNLQKHISYMHRGPYRCRVACQQEFKNAGGRNRHELTVHTARENAAWRCALCNCSFRIERELKNHYRSGHPKSS